MYQWISWFLDTILWNLDFSFKSSNTNLQCSTPRASYDILSSLCMSGRTAGVWDISISFSPRLLSQPRVLYGIWYPVRVFEMNTDIWDISISTPPYTGIAPWENRSSIIVIISCLNRPGHYRPSKSFVPLRGNVTFSAPLSQVKNKEWRLSVERSNWNGSMMPSGGALKNQLD